MIEQKREIVSTPKFALIIKRLCHQILENYSNLSNLCILGMQPRGTVLSDLIVHQIYENFNITIIYYGKLDITFYRDDFRTRNQPLKAFSNEINFSIDKKDVLLIDDVLYTGRSVHAAMASLQHYGRPNSVELLTMIDRRFNREFPIQANFIGKTVDSVDEAYVKLNWNEQQDAASVYIYPFKNEIA